MNPSSKPLLSVLNGTPVWPPPIWLMRQAGRYLPEYRAIRAEVPDFIALCLDPGRAAEVTLQPIRRFGFDAAILFSDILILPWALGHGLTFKEGEGPVLPKLRDAASVAALDPSRVAAAVAPVMETVRQVRSGLAREGFGHTALIGFAGAPFTVACYMVEGGGSRDFAATRAMAYADPGLFKALMDNAHPGHDCLPVRPDRGWGRSPDAVRQLGRRPGPSAVPDPCHRRHPVDRRTAESQRIPLCRSSASPASLA